jgi:hypothetical protein
MGLLLLARMENREEPEITDLVGQEEREMITRE